jgi:hypothetical protein
VGAVVNENKVGFYLRHTSQKVPVQFKKSGTKKEFILETIINPFQKIPNAPGGPDVVSEKILAESESVNFAADLLEGVGQGLFVYFHIEISDNQDFYFFTC